VCKTDAAKRFGFVTQLKKWLGLVLHPTKGESDGTQQLTLLRFTIDTTANQARLPDARLARLRGTAAAVLASASANRRWVRRKPLDSVAGIIVSASLAIPEAKLFARSAYDDLGQSAAVRGPLAACQLSHQSLRDLRWWANFGRAGHGRPLWPRAPAHTMHTDASGFGWGGVADERPPVRSIFTDAERRWHINVKEVAAIRLSLTALASSFSTGDVAQVITDSRVALHVVNTLVSRSVPLCAEVRLLDTVAHRLGVTLDAEWIPTADNVWADWLSRPRDSITWSLDPTFCAVLHFVYGPHNTTCLPPPPLTPSIGDVRAFMRAPFAPTSLDSTLGPGNHWMNRPFISILLVLTQIKAHRATATILVPVWRAQPWWRPALLQADEIVYLPRRAGV